MTRVDSSGETPRSSDTEAAQNRLIVSVLTTVRTFMSTGLAPAQYQNVFSALLKDVIDLRNLRDAEAVYRQGANGGVEPRAGSAEATAVMPSTETGDNKRINQGAYRGQGNLGNGARTLSGSGCLLASMTMSANRLNNTNTNLVQANAVTTRAKVYDGDSNMRYEAGANALNLSVLGRKSTRAAGWQDEAVARLQDQRPALQLIAGVNTKAGSRSAVSNADHYINIHSASADGDTLYGVDPAGGRDVTYRKGSDGIFRNGNIEIAEIAVVTSRNPSLTVSRRIEAK